LGKAKGRHENHSSQEKGWNYRCWTEKAFPTDESSLGGKARTRSRSRTN
jgi:hypothetical protein